MSDAVIQRYGLNIEIQEVDSSDSLCIQLSPTGVEPFKSFSIVFSFGWRSITGEFLLGNFASELMHNISTSSKDQKALFSLFSESLINQGCTLNLQLGGKKADPVDVDKWPDNWDTIKISFSKIGISFEADKNVNYSLVLPILLSFVGICFSLLPLTITTDEVEGQEEGRVIERVTKQYERSKTNRAACIEIFGISCNICGVNFGNKYGEIGESFIHVHHRKPLSLMEESYILDPRNDLIPICPNCHAMVHRKTPPYSTDEIIEILDKRGQSNGQT